MLKISHISKTFNPGTVNEKKAIEDLSLELKKGDFATIIGSNGCLLYTSCYQAFVPCMARGVLLEKLDETGMRKVYDEIELPLVFTLDSMEKWGISVKGEELKSYGEKLKVRIQELEKTIWQEAGEEFNINSPKQLGVILFEKLGLPGGKKTKTGYSTAADILDKLEMCIRDR